MHYEVLDDKQQELLDIGCMKLSAIVSRSELKDYVDLFFILNQIVLSDLLGKLFVKMPSLDRNLALKALATFSDIHNDPIDFIEGNYVDIKDIQTTITKMIRELNIAENSI